MAFPASNVNTSNLDAGTKKKQLARADLLDLTQKFNQLRDHVSTFIQPLLASVDAAAARLYLGIKSRVFRHYYLVGDQGAAASGSYVAFPLNPQYVTADIGGFTTSGMSKLIAPRAGVIRFTANSCTFNTTSVSPSVALNVRVRINGAMYVHPTALAQTNATPVAYGRGFTACASVNQGDEVELIYSVVPDGSIIPQLQGLSVDYAD